MCWYFTGTVLDEIAFRADRPGIFRWVEVGIEVATSSRCWAEWLGIRLGSFGSKRRPSSRTGGVSFFGVGRGGFRAKTP
jgi:hypothetical protein